MSLTNCWNLRVTAEVNQGGRRYMEDVMAVQFERAKGERKVVEYAAFAVFDGHGGKEAAHFARDNILDNIKAQKGFFSKDVHCVKKAIKDGFLSTHHQMWNELPNWPKTYNGHPSTAGTTASLVLIRGNKMYVANVGDSMVVMGTRANCYKDNPRAFQAMELTVDHKPELPEEKKRIEKCGGCIMNKAGVNRVVWNRPKIAHTGPIRRSTKLDRIPFLAIARSLGDLWSFNSVQNEFIVSPVPDVHVYDLIDGREQFIVLASDGLWNMVRPYESVTTAGTFDDRKRKKQVNGTPAHELVQLALDRWKMRAMRADNTSVIVVYIERKKMEPISKKRETYSESWTSARLEGSKFKVDNIPFSNAEKATSDDDNSEANAESEDISTSDDSPTPNISSQDYSQGEPSTSTAKAEPVQDSSISSSSGETTEKLDDPVSKLERNQEEEKKRLKRRKSAESLGASSALPESRGPSTRKRCKTDFTAAALEKSDRKQRPKSLERSQISTRSTRSSLPAAKSVPTTRSRSEPSLASPRRGLRKRNSAAKYTK